MKNTQAPALSSTKNSATSNDKLPYTAPELTIHGTAEELTKALETASNCDAVQFGNDPCS